MSVFRRAWAGLLTAERRQLRDWALFGLAALVPALAIGWIALRAIANEEAAVRSEALQNLEAAAERGARQMREQTDESSRQLAEMARRTSPSDDLRSWDRIDAATAACPPFATLIVVDPTGDVLVPRGPSVAKGAATVPKAPTECALWARELRSNQHPAQPTASFLDRCQTHRTSSGRYLWPVVALSKKTAGPELLDWMERYGDRLSPTEREATRRAVERAEHLVGERKSLLAVLGESVHSAHRRIAATLRGSQAVDALRAAQADAAFRPKEWQTPTSVGWVVATPSGARVGWVVDRVSLESGLSGNWLVDEDKIGTVSSDAASDTERVRSFPVAERLFVNLGFRDPQAIELRTAKSKRVLAGIAIGSTLLALALALGLFGRMRAAKRSSELRTGFVSTVSHELRTPIASVRMLAELLEQDRVEPEERAEVHSALSREARRLGETVDRLLGFGRMAAGRITLDKKSTPIAEPVRASAAAFVEQHPSHPVEVDIDDDLRANVDVDQVRLALDNLLANARKYAPNGTPYRISAEQRHRHIILLVSDSGPGIDRRHHRRIFRPFERANDKLSEATEGSGIGLSLVRHVAELHGGSVTVESSPGNGATFVLRLPNEAKTS